MDAEIEKLRLNVIYPEDIEYMNSIDSENEKQTRENETFMIQNRFLTGKSDTLQPRYKGYDKKERLGRVDYLSKRGSILRDYKNEFLLTAEQDLIAESSQSSNDEDTKKH